MVKPQPRKAVITGGTSGIGAATARLLLARGYEVTATGLLASEIEQCQADTNMQGIILQQLDVADTDQVGEFFKRFGSLSALVTCAGIGRGAGEFNEAGFMQTVDVNLNGTMRCCYAAETALTAGKGAIVNIASVMSVFGSGTAPAYSASKGAVLQFTKSLAVAWGEQGVRVNAVAPGWTETPMTTAMQADQERNRKVLERTPSCVLENPKASCMGT